MIIDERKSQLSEKGEECTWTTDLMRIRIKSSEKLGKVLKDTDNLKDGTCYEGCAYGISILEVPDVTEEKEVIAIMRTFNDEIKNEDLKVGPERWEINIPIKQSMKDLSKRVFK